MAATLKQGGPDLLKKRLASFMSTFLPTVKFHQLPFFTDIHGKAASATPSDRECCCNAGFQFLPVDKTTFLSIQYLLNLVSTNFPLIRASALMYAGKVVWSSINQVGLVRRALQCVTLSVIGARMDVQEDMFLLYQLEALGDQAAAMRAFYSFLALLSFDVEQVASLPAPAAGATAATAAGLSADSKSPASSSSRVSSAAADSKDSSAAAMPSFT